MGQRTPSGYVRPHKALYSTYRGGSSKSRGSPLCGGQHARDDNIASDRLVECRRWRAFKARRQALRKDEMMIKGQKGRISASACCGVTYTGDLRLSGGMK